MTVPPHEAIRNLLGRYCEAMDAGDLDALAEMFEGARLTDEHGRVTAADADGVRRLYGEGTRRWDGSPRTRHLTSNSIIDVDEGAGAATARSSYVVFQATDGFPLQPIIAGRYRDRFALRDGEWRFVERAFAVDQVGDLSHHLTFDLPQA